MFGLTIAQTVALAGLIIGLFAGIIMQRTKFCTWGGVYDIMAGEGGSRFRAWLLAMAVAILGTQLLVFYGILDLGKAVQLSPNLGWGTLVAGGLIFGIGMALARGCGARNLVRFGSGDLKAFVIVIIFGLTAYMTLRGQLSHITSFINGLASFDLKSLGAESASVAELIAKATPAGQYLAGADITLVTVATIVVLLALLTFLSASFRGSTKDIIGGLGVGLAVIAGWLATGYLGYDDFEEKTVFPLFSLNFVSPVGDTLQSLMIGSGVTFGIATVVGLVLGSFISSLISRDFELAGFDDARDLGRSIIGAMMMGIGAVAAFGCTIGQGVSGVSTLALGSFVALLSIIVGAVIGYKIRFR